jgi:DNA repair exonuclease SbcCD nuclease subunit
MKILRVGDPHVQIKNLKDSENLIDFAIQTAKERDVPIIEFLGDLFHTHAILRIEVVKFWQEAFKKIEIEGLQCRVLVGNHDQPGSKEKEQEMNAVSIFDTPITAANIQRGNRIIIDKPKVLGKIGYIPYMSSEEDFLQAARILYKQGATQMLVAHQTFTGAQYENGFFSEEGIDPALVPQQQIISGHIHKRQEIGKCFYPGTPKWDTMADANQPKGIWIFDHDNLGNVVIKEFISTKHIVTPITSYVVKEGEELPELNPDARNYITLEGKTAWISKLKKQLKDKANIKVKPTDVRVTKDIKDSNQTLEGYLDNEFQPIEGVGKIDIKEFLRDV